MTHFHTRALIRADLSALSPVLDETGLFPPDMLPPMAEPYLSGEAPHQWLVAHAGGPPLGFAYAEPERMTDRAFNLLAIAVLPAHQKRGAGKALVHALEQRLRAQGARVLLVESSSLPAYGATRSFYDGLGFTREARIRDFYTDGEDKIVFWKRMSGG